MGAGCSLSSPSLWEGAWPRAWGRLGSLVEGGAGVPDSASRTGRGPQGPAARGWGTVCRHRE